MMHPSKIILHILNDIKQYENLKDLKKLLNKYNVTLQKINKHDFLSNSEIEKAIVDIHIFLTTLCWHIQEVDELLIKVSKKLSEIN